MHSAHVASPADVTGARQSDVARLVNSIVDPVAAFRDIRDRQPWALALLVSIALRFASLFAFYRPALTLPKVLGSLAFQVVSVLPPVLMLTFVVWLAAKVWSVGARWGQVFSICAHVFVAYTLASIAIASVAGAVLPASVSVDLRNPPYTNLASLADAVNAPVLHRLAGQFDVRSAYGLLLVWIGLRASAHGSGWASARTVATVAAVRLATVLAIALTR